MQQFVLAPLDAPTLIMIAETAAAKGRPASALNALGQAAAAAPASAEMLKIAVLYTRLGRKDRARDLVGAVLGQTPQGHWRRPILALVAGSARERQEARTQLEHTPVTASDFWPMRRIGFTLQALGHYPEAFLLLEKLIAKRPSQAALWNDRGVLNFLLGRPEQAEEDLKKAIRLKPGLLDAAVTLGGIWTAAGRCREADSLYARALAQPMSWENRPVHRLIETERAKLNCPPDPR